MPIFNTIAESYDKSVHIIIHIVLSRVCNHNNISSSYKEYVPTPQSGYKCRKRWHDEGRTCSLSRGHPLSVPCTACRRWQRQWR